MTEQPTAATQMAADPMARAVADSYDSGWNDLLAEVRLAVQAVADGRHDLAWLQQRIEALGESAAEEPS